MGNCPLTGPAPVNNVCSTATVLTPTGGGTSFKIGDLIEDSFVVTDDNCNSFNIGGTVVLPKCTNLGAPDALPQLTTFGVWYKTTVEEACVINLSLSTCDTPSRNNIDTAIAVYKGTCGELTDFDAATGACLGAADDTCGADGVLTELSLSEPSVDGTEDYYIFVYSGDDRLFDDNLGTGTFVLRGEITGTPKSQCGGDPHFSRWNHDKRDSFHGECDLVLLHSSTFQDETGLDVHIRTTIMENDFSYSYIEAAAVRIGEIVLEFHPTYFLVNGVNHDYHATPAFEFEENEHMYTISNTETGKFKRETIIQLNAASSIKIRSTKDLMYVDFKGNKVDFGDSVGMLGNYTTGELYGRDGLFENDYLQYGFEWQVDPNKDDPILFATNRAPQLPYERCRLPAEAFTTSRRRLNAKYYDIHQKAVAACKDAKADFDLCVDDVVATGDVDAAEMFVETA